MDYVIRVYRLTGEPMGYLADYDPDYRADNAAVYPTGFVGTSSDPADAVTFPSHEAAIEAVLRQSDRVPRRPDGQPNRPLTAWTVEIIPKERAL